MTEPTLASEGRASRPGDKVRARCPDGSVRTATVTTWSDTFFSTPARVSASGKTVSGRLAISDDIFVFYPEGANAHLLTEGSSD